MTTATSPSPESIRSASATKAGVSHVTIRGTASFGWYDPDGAGWESDTTTLFEAPRATPARPSIVVETVDEPDH
jgi:hypothetical protein